MKPLSSITQLSRSFRGETLPMRSRDKHPVISAHYHAQEAELRGTHGGLKLASPSFRELSRRFLGAEMKRDYVAEAFFFAIIVGVSAWPIAIMMRALSELVK